MKKSGIILLLLALFLELQGQDEKMNRFISDLMNKMTLEEKLGQLNLITAGGFITGTAVNEKAHQKIQSGQIGAMLNGFSLASMKASQEIAVKESPNHIPCSLGWMLFTGIVQYFLYH